eukprot:CAMPEP_0181119034 /NCGR_PEP_ID=MMETSP1071-20121207/23391_1 /TAXON_ID=35127 /ORGANISM="Thalassiosira sp., Strain NH16" /LENGTH=439 /DNA_ID=CAMNT_0023203563 /DNA_START=125 /DNA_END=1444 /DNA_ORIENTATION=-
MARISFMFSKKSTLPISLPRGGGGRAGNKKCSAEKILFSLGATVMLAFTASIAMNHNATVLKGGKFQEQVGIAHENPKKLVVHKPKPSGSHITMDGQLSILLHKLDIPPSSSSSLKHSWEGSGRLVDLGAGVRDNDPCFELIDSGWSALLIDGDPTQPDKWSNRFPNVYATATNDVKNANSDVDGTDKNGRSAERNNNYQPVKGVVGYILADTIVKLLTENAYGQNIDLLKIDIDSFDCHVMKAILNGGIRPKVIVMEANVKFPPQIRFAMTPGYEESGTQIGFDSEKRGTFYGCSMGYQVHDVMAPNGYDLYYMDWNNVMYIDTNLYNTNQQSGGNVAAEDKKKNLQSAVNDWYDYAYWKRPDRDRAFSFNVHLKRWNGMSTDDIRKDIEKMTKTAPIQSHAKHFISVNDKDYCIDNIGRIVQWENNMGDGVCSSSVL